MATSFPTPSGQSDLTLSHDSGQGYSIVIPCSKTRHRGRFWLLAATVIAATLALASVRSGAEDVLIQPTAARAVPDMAQEPRTD